MKKAIPFVIATALLSSCVLTGKNKTTCPEVDVDTVFTKCPEMDSLSWKFSFNTKEAMAKFKAEIEEKLGNLMEINTLDIDTNKEIKVSYIPTEGINILDTSGYTIISDSTKNTDSIKTNLIDFKKDAQLTVLSPLPYQYSPFKVLAMDTIAPHLKLQKMGNISTISINPSAMGTGNSIDLIEQWNNFLIIHPAVGKAILGDVQGLEEAAKGNAKSIQGLRSTSMNAISLSTSFSQKEIIKEHLQLLPGISGAFYENSAENKTTYSIVSPGAIPHVAKATILYKEEFDPVLSFSMKKSDAAILYKKSNINDIKRRRTEATVAKIDDLNFFISLSSNLTDNLREQIAGKIAPLKILNSLDCDGVQIERLTQRDKETPLAMGGNVFQPSNSELKLIYPTNNPLAAEVAATIAYSLSQAGLKVQLVDDKEAYEQSLYYNSFDIALGVINESQLQIPSIESYIADYWFNGEKEEETRIKTFTEVPLFSVSLYLAMQENTAIYEKNLKQIYKQ